MMKSSTVGSTWGRGLITVVAGLALLALAPACGDDLKPNPPAASGGTSGVGGRGGSGSGGATGTGGQAGTGDAAVDGNNEDVGAAPDGASDDTGAGTGDAPADASGADAVSASCGGDGQPCCRGKTCSGGGCCIVNNSGSGSTCVGQAKSCKRGSDGFPGFCYSGSCGNIDSPCGALTQACCDPGGGVQVKCTATGTTCSNGTCAGCGRPGEPGCNGGPANDDVYRCAAGAVLQGATCTACGAEGQPCCVDEAAACTGALTCQGGGPNKKCRV